MSSLATSLPKCHSAALCSIAAGCWSKRVQWLNGRWPRRIVRAYDNLQIAQGVAFAMLQPGKMAPD
jgi:hypothetical protein